MEFTIEECRRDYRKLKVNKHMLKKQQSEDTFLLNKIQKEGSRTTEFLNWKIDKNERVLKIIDLQLEFMNLYIDTDGDVDRLLRNGDAAKFIYATRIKHEVMAVVELGQNLFTNGEYETGDSIALDAHLKQRVESLKKKSP